MRNVEKGTTKLFALFIEGSSTLFVFFHTNATRVFFLPPATTTKKMSKKQDGAEYSKFKSYEYRSNSNLVLQAENRPRPQNEPSGEAESLRGKELPRMGDMAQREKAKAAAKEEKKKTTTKKKVTLTTSVNSIVDQSYYQPKTEETAIVYESLLYFLQPFLGDISPDVLREAADEILAILKDDHISDGERFKGVRVLLKNITDEEFAKLIQFGKEITDFSTDREAMQDDTSNMETQGLSVVFNEDEQAEDDAEHVHEIPEDEEEDDQGQDTEQKDTVGISADMDLETTQEQEQALQVDAKTIDAHWLQRELAKYYKDANVSQRMANDVLELLSLEDDNDCETRLVLLLDMDKFKLIQKLVVNRFKIVFAIKLAKAKSTEEKQQIEDEMASSDQLRPILEEIKGNKVESKKRAKKSDAMDIDEDEKVDKAQVKNLDLEALAFEQEGHLMANKTVELPKTTQRVTFKGYEEITIPAPAAPAMGDDEKLVPIAELPAWAQPAFTKVGVKNLNRIQSRLYKHAFYSPENLLLCAPTGAGKTNVAVLTILHEMGQHMNKDGQLIEKDFKIIYVAPMKALVQEVVGNLSERLQSMGMNVQELSGDKNMTKQQIADTQIIVTTPEKWDIVTRKSGDRSYVEKVKLIIIDEVHLLHDERGPVLESIVARTIRQQESTEENIRIVGLSATLPNYVDVANFLRVKKNGLFHFTGAFRPVPLRQQYIGVTERKAFKRQQLMNEITYDKVIEQVNNGAQVLVFVHSRKETAKTAKFIRDMAIEKDTVAKFLGTKQGTKVILNQELANVKHADLKELLPYGFGIHNAGLNREDRTLVEDLFGAGHIQVLVSTATLAWGVNLPAHCVIIKGTQIYNPEKGRWVELSLLDVMQMFGRAGRPQYDTFGEGIIITTHQELQFYLSLLNQQLPIESQYIKKLADNLNAEIVLGTVQNVHEATSWLRYTYLQVRMLKNPRLYGIDLDDADHDPKNEHRREELIHSAATLLDKHGLIKYDRKTGGFQVTELGRVASHYYISYRSMANFNEHMKPQMSDVELFRLFTLSEEFKYMSIRQEEKLELQKLLERVPIPVKESIDEASSKVNVLLQAYISQLRLDGFALMADMVYVTQSAGRIMRALFEIALRKGWAQVAEKCLTMAKMIERRMWSTQSPLRQFPSIPAEVVKQMEKKDIAWERLYDLNPAELGDAVRYAKIGPTLYKTIHQFPRLDLLAHMVPITRSMLRVELTIVPDFEYNDKAHGPAETFWITVVDVDGEVILHQEQFILKKKFATEEHYITFTVPIYDPVPPQYFIRVWSDRWLGPSTVLPISFRHLVLPEKYPPPTELLDMQPLQISALRNPKFEQIFAGYKRFNPIQTQVFHTAYGTDENMLLAAPNGSGKTAVAEMAILRAIATHGDNLRCVYVAPMESIVKQRFKDWTRKFKLLGKSVQLLTGEPLNDGKVLEHTHICLSTPESWDNLSRKWKTKKSVQAVNLFIMDELHMIGAENGHILEMIGSRMRVIASQLAKPIRIVGLASSVANAHNLGDWIGASTKAHSLFNFHPSVRPVPLEVNIQGFAQASFGSRMLAMSKPTYTALKQKSQGKPSIIFAASRKQARFAATELITYISADGNSRMFIDLPEDDMKPYLAKITNKTLQHCLPYGIAVYHEDLSEQERDIIQQLYNSGAIKLLICTYTECWALDMNAHLVIIMGTQYYDGKDHRYVDYTLADLLQMMGRSSRPSIDDSGVCMIFCHAPRKDYYKKFLYEPFPVESHLNHFLADHMNAEIANGTITSKQGCLEFIVHTFLYRRLRQNPNYYNLRATSHTAISEFLSDLVQNTLNELSTAKCIAVEATDISILNLGMIAAHYYIKYTTIELFSSSLTGKTKLRGIVEILAAAAEFDNLPIRKQEAEALRKLSLHLPLKIDKVKFTDPHTKVNILLQAHFSRMMLTSEMEKDKALVLSLAIKLLQAMVDVTSTQLWLTPSLACMELCQMIVQALWDKDPQLLQLPHFSRELAKKCEDAEVKSIYDLIEMEDDARNKLLMFGTEQMEHLATALNRYPNVDVEFALADAENIETNGIVAVNVSFEVEEATTPVQALNFPKEKYEEWWIVVGDPQHNLCAFIRRRMIQGKSDMQVKFKAPEAPGDYCYKLYLMCDSYAGVDHELDLEFTVKQAAVTAEPEEEAMQD